MKKESWWLVWTQKSKWEETKISKNWETTTLNCSRNSSVSRTQTNAKNISLTLADSWHLNKLTFLQDPRRPAETEPTICTCASPWTEATWTADAKEEHVLTPWNSETSESHKKHSETLRKSCLLLFVLTELLVLLLGKRMSTTIFQSLMSSYETERVHESKMTRLLRHV